MRSTIWRPSTGKLPPPPPPPLPPNSHRARHAARRKRLDQRSASGTPPHARHTEVKSRHFRGLFPKNSLFFFKKKKRMRSAYSARGPAEWTGAVENFRRKIETVCATAAHTKSSLACPTGRRSKLWAMYCSHAQLWARSLHSTTNWFSYRSPRSGEFDRSAQWRHASPRPWLIRAQRFNGSPTGSQGLS